MAIRVSVRNVVLACSVLSSGPVLAWGQSGHMIVNRAAIQLMTSKDKSFFAANADNIAAFAKTPDLLWKQAATYEKERPMHFFQWDRYEASQLAALLPVDLSKALATVGSSYLDENGTAPWRAAQIFVKLRDALAKKDCATALQMAGTLGHYIGDLSQPMHNSSDYDGQSIHKPGVHKYFESTLVDKVNQAKLLADVIKAGSSNMHVEGSTAGQPLDVIRLSVEESQAALEELPQILDYLTEKPVNDRGLTDQLVPAMANGAFVLARVWDMAVNAAGTKAVSGPHCLASPLKVSDPAWFPIK